MSLILTLPENYGLVLLSSVAIAIQCFLVGFTVAEGKRIKYFNQEFLEKNFGDEHKKEFGTSVPKFGYPDHGSGRYSQKLSYKAWFVLNNAQRCHQNFLESVALLIFAILISGVLFPKAAAIIGTIHFVGRIFYILGYTTKGGADNRLIGAGLAHGTTLIALGLATFTSLKLSNLV